MELEGYLKQLQVTKIWSRLQYRRYAKREFVSHQINFRMPTYSASGKWGHAGQEHRRFRAS